MDVVLALLVLGFIISTLISCARNLECSDSMGLFGSIYRRKASLLLDCLTSASMVLSMFSEHAHQYCMSLSLYKEWNVPEHGILQMSQDNYNVLFLAVECSCIFRHQGIRGETAQVYSYQVTWLL